jgi:hypothetical protein
MKLNKWTLGLAALGLVSLTSVARADEAKTTPLLTALSATTISGYVDTSMEWNPGTGNLSPAPFKFNAGKQDGFNVDSVNLRIAKPLEEGQWSSGYVVDLMFGPDTSLTTGEGGGVNSGIAEHVRQAYVNLRMPVGNGLDWKIGRFDSPLGYESVDGYKDPNFTRSYGFTFEPSEQTGVLAEYRITESVAISGGVANTVTTGPINSRGNAPAESSKAWIGMVNLTAPESWGAIGGSGLYFGSEYGPSFAADGKQRWHNYVGATIKTPVQGLTLGASWDDIHKLDVAGVDTGYNMAVAGYASFKFTDKASLHVRGEYARGAGLGALADAFNGTTFVDYGTSGVGGNPLRKVIALTGTFQYDLWQNVISRLEVRWDHQADGNPAAFGGTSEAAAFNPDFGSAPAIADIKGTKKNEVLVAANLIFKF